MIISGQLFELFPEISVDLWYTPFIKATAACLKDIGAGGWLYREYKSIRKELRLAKKLPPKPEKKTNETSTENAENRKF